ncbi:hypothetical protein KAU33_15680 [Candidatus Dependentiae bacterium]|nr:hypothetical protein [Candidatus Dependentiae bacterium]
MSKTKGWKKIGEDEWENESTGSILKVEKFDTGFFTSFKASGSGFEATELYDITEGDLWARRQDVVDATIEFMRKNPKF